MSLSLRLPCLFIVTNLFLIDNETTIANKILKFTQNKQGNLFLNFHFRKLNSFQIVAVTAERRNREKAITNTITLRS